MIDTGHRARIDAGVSFDWSGLPPLVDALDAVPPDVERLHFRRLKSSHRGLAKLRGLRQLWLRGANQAAIAEVSALADLEILHVDGITAADLSPLGNNRSLRRLIVKGGTKVESLGWVERLSPELEVLALEGFFRVKDLAPLASLQTLRSLGFEGGIDRKARIATLRPLAGMARLSHLFLAATEVADRSLEPLHGIRTLSRLECGAYFPDSEFLALRRALPGLGCDWIGMIEAHGSVRAGMSAMKRSWRA